MREDFVVFGFFLLVDLLIVLWVRDLAGAGAWAVGVVGATAGADVSGAGAAPPAGACARAIVATLLPATKASSVNAEINVFMDSS